MSEVHDNIPQAGVVRITTFKFNSSESGGAPPPTTNPMVTTKRGRPLAKYINDLFASVLLSLQPQKLRVLFWIFPNSISSQEVIDALITLKYSHSSRSKLDLAVAPHMVAITTMIEFSMGLEMAKALCQDFMDARLLENAADKNDNMFNHRVIFTPTPKGLHVLDRFGAKNGASIKQYQHILETQPSTVKLLRLERRSVDDEIIVTQPMIHELFRFCVGFQPNSFDPGASDALSLHQNRLDGISMNDRTTRSIIEKGGGSLLPHCFPSMSLIEWICDFTTVVGREEAAEICAQFVRFGLITLEIDQRKKSSAIIFTVRGSRMEDMGEYRCTTKAIYRVTDEGCRIARWSAQDPEIPAFPIKQKLSPIVEQDVSEKPPNLLRYNPKSRTPRFRGRPLPKRKLQMIFGSASLRSLFQTMLKERDCDACVPLCLDVQDVMYKHQLLSRTIKLFSPSSPQNIIPTSMHVHGKLLVASIFGIYNQYLRSPESRSKMNITQPLVKELTACIDALPGCLLPASLGVPARLALSTFDLIPLSGLNDLVEVYGRIERHITDWLTVEWIPKFAKSTHFVNSPQYLCFCWELSDVNDQFSAISGWPEALRLLKEFLRGKPLEQRFLFWMNVNELRSAFETNACATNDGHLYARSVENAARIHHRALMMKFMDIYSQYLNKSDWDNWTSVMLQEDARIILERCQESVPDAGTDNEGNVPPISQTYLDQSLRDLRALLTKYEQLQTKDANKIATYVVPEFVKTTDFTTLVDDKKRDLASKLESTPTDSEETILPFCTISMRAGGQMRRR